MSSPHRSPRLRHLGAAAALALLLSPVAACSTSGGQDADETTITVGGQVDETTTTIEEDPAPTTTEVDDTTTTTTESRGSGGSDDALVDAFIQGAASELVRDPSLDMDRAQAECTATAWADALGPERITATAFSPERFVEGDVDLARQIVDGMTDCGLDLDEMMHEELTTVQGLTPSQADCVIGELPPGALRDVIALEMAGQLQGDDDPVVDVFFNAGVACAGA